MDGLGNKEFPHPKQKHELSQKIKTSVVPALFIVDPISNSVVLVGHGYMNRSLLEKKVLSASFQLQNNRRITAHE